MRGTHHFLAGSDIRWLIELTIAALVAADHEWAHQLGLDEKVLARAMRVLGEALEGRNHLTRADVASVLGRAKIATEGQRLAHVIYHAELEGLVKSHPQLASDESGLAIQDAVGSPSGDTNADPR